MRAKRITEDLSNVLQGKAKQEIIDNVMNIDTAYPVIDALDQIAQNIPPGTFTYDEMRSLMEQLTKMGLDYWLDIGLEDVIDQWENPDEDESVL